MFLYKNLFFSISSILSIPLMLIGINGGYFPAICRVCFFNYQFIFWLHCVEAVGCISLGVNASLGVHVFLFMHNNGLDFLVLLKN